MQGPLRLLAAYRLSAHHGWYLAVRGLEYACLAPFAREYTLHYLQMREYGMDHARMWEIPEPGIGKIPNDALHQTIATSVIGSQVIKIYGKNCVVGTPDEGPFAFAGIVADR